MDNTGTSSWKAGQFFNLKDYGVVDGVDYHTLTWQNRSVNLEMLKAPPGKVITGVRFAVDTGSLKIEIRATAFDFNTGLLDDGIAGSEWISNTINDKTPIVLERPDLPTRTSSKSIPYVETNKFIEFQPTDKYLDAAQTTIPFIDIQLVESANPGPLAGIGLYYKGQPNYGGFIAPKILTYDYTEHVKTKWKVYFKCCK